MNIQRFELVNFPGIANMFVSFIYRDEAGRAPSFGPALARFSEQRLLDATA